MRKIINLNNDWEFFKDCKELKKKIAGEKVNLPHTWNNEDGQDGGNDYFRGNCLYRKQVKLSVLPKSEEYYLEILAANSSAEVFVNGEKVGGHDGGYSKWRVRITPLLREENEIIIVVDNAPNDRVYPQTADFTFYGGLYRGVNLICLPNTHFDLEYYGSSGLEITPRIEGDNALVRLKSYPVNLQEGDTISYAILDKKGGMVATKVSSNAEEELLIKDVRLWKGRKDPYLYTAKVAILREGKEIDEVVSKFGCRSFSIHPEKGFILNGEEYPLRGVSRHQDKWKKGNALTKEDHEEDIRLIMEMGATTVRLAHYQHDEYFYELCDKNGLIVWAEIPYISKHLPKGNENTLLQLKELIAQNYNHPSIVVWGLSNEITIGGTSEDLLENHKRLNDLAHEMDKTRLTAVACVSPCPMDEPYAHISDLVSYNHYFGWYGGNTEMNGPWLDSFHAKYPNRPIGVSEYGCEGLNWHTSTPMQGDYTEEYQAYYHEELIKQLFTRKYLWATHVWNMFDFGADARNEGGENGQNHKGLVTFDRKYKKDAFYAYKAWLSSEPFVHICGKRYIERAEEITKITVYSNQAEVELFINGKSFEKQKSETHFFYFQIPNVGESKLLVKAGGCEDCSRIRKVEKMPERYILKEKGAVLNWFDVTAPEGVFSLNDSLADILSCEEGRKLFGTLSRKFEKTGSFAGFEINGDMMQMLGGFTLLRLTNMMGMMEIKFTKEELLALNEKLNAIEKPKK